MTDNRVVNSARRLLRDDPPWTRQAIGAMAYVTFSLTRV